jgi:hypothetical protein
MNKKTAILTAVLAACTQPAWGYSGDERGRSSSAAPQSQGQPATRLTAMAQRSLLRHCLYTAELARDHMREFLRSATHRRPSADEMQQHLREVRSATDSMFEDHRRFLYSLTDEQWTAAKDTITALEQLRASIQVQVQGIDLELQMPTPDVKVLARYGRKTQTLLEDWRKQHRKMAALTGIRL